MATIIPNQSSGKKTVITCFNLLKKLPDSYYVWQNTNEPRLFLVQQSQGETAVFAISSIKNKAVEEAAGLFGQGKFVAQAVYDLVEPFAKQKGLITAVLYPNLSTRQGQLLKPPNSPVHHLYKEQIKPEKLAEWLQQQGQPLTETQQEQLRRQFTPEVVVPANLTARPTTIERNTQAILTPYLLDYDQEQMVKQDWWLPDTAQEMVTDRQPQQLRLINGVAGSGKSLILLYRIKFLRQAHPGKQMLVLTHNRALIKNLKERYEQLVGKSDPMVTWYNFSQFCVRYWPKKIRPKPDMLELWQQIALVEDIWQESELVKTAVSASLLHDEIRWYKDNLLFSKEDYLNADRTGRGFPLTTAMRHRVYATMKQYHKAVRDQDKIEWGDLPRQIWRFCQRGQLTLPTYPFVFIDEAQFFAPVWFEIVKQLLRPEGHQLFLVADPTQGFLKRRQSWLASGLEVRGRTQWLHKSYRTTRQIMELARLMYQHRLPDDDEAVPIDLDNMPTGAPPLMISTSSEQDEVSRVVNEVCQLIEAGHPPNHILLLPVEPYKARQLMARLNAQLEQEIAYDPRQDEQKPSHQLRVCTLDASTGLESPIVFIVGLRALHEKEHSLDLSPGEQVELIRDNTRRLYMAMTRAGQRLIISYVGPPPDMLRIPLEKLNSHKT